MVASLAFLSSPLLGPSVWQPVVQVLVANGWTATTCAAPMSPRTAQEVLDTFLASLPTDEDLVLIPHSNAGAYVPALSTQRSTVGAVFVDAILPPRCGHLPLAPPTFLDFLRQRADVDGVLPVWTEWWDEAEVAALLPDGRTRRRIEREQSRMHLSYFEDHLVVPEGWDERPGAYLAFGDTYGRERDDAERRQWPITTLAGAHLHLVNEPAQVANALGELLRRMGVASPEL